MKTSIVFAAAASAASTAIELVGSSGTWTSPGYPAYKANCHQRYFKAVGSQELLVLEFEHVDIEFDKSVSFILNFREKWLRVTNKKNLLRVNSPIQCTFDYLMINGEKICEESNSYAVTTMTTTTVSTTTTTEYALFESAEKFLLTDDLDALFHTDKVFNYAGFKINWVVEDLCSYESNQAHVLAKQAANC